MNISFGEIKIKELLESFRIPYKNQYQPSGTVFYFDFYVDNSFYLEFDGHQHADINSAWFSKEAALRDMKKNEYCLKNNIPLFRIPYGYRHSLTLDLLTDDEFRVKTIDHYGLLPYFEQEDIK